ncbi:MAG: myxococcus cysteine-rich repeat containing protein [Acidobacteriota bacterium]
MRIPALACAAVLVASTAAATPRELAGWHATVDRDTGVPAWLWGGHVDVPGADADAAIAERAARAFLAAHRDVLAPGAGDFVVVANRVDRGVRTVGFGQVWHGAPVIGGQIGFVFAHDRLFAISSRVKPNIPAVLPRATAVLRLASGDYRAVDVIDAGDFDVYVDATGEVGRTRKVLDATSTLVYDAGLRYATGPRALQPAPGAHITINGGAATTGTDGSFTWTGTGTVTVAPGLSGMFVTIVDAAQPLASASLVAQPGVPTMWSLASNEYGDAELSTYVYANIAKARARVIEPSLGTWLDTPLSFDVNEDGTPCNAFATPQDVHFTRAMGACQNTGRIADIVFHEFGHTLHNHAIIAGMGAYDVPLSEGLADFNAANITEDAAVGRGLYFDDKPMRDIDPYGLERRWPDDDDYDPHLAGEVVSGALWDLRTRLVASLGHTAGVAQAEAIFAGVMERAADIPGSYLAALVADDNDGDLSNGTPHYCDIQRAFGAHGLAGADYQPTIVASPTVTGDAIAVAVTTPAAGACPVSQVVGITVVWQVGDGVPGTFALAEHAGTWTGTFPSVPDGTIVMYTIDAALDDGSHVVLPENPADPMYERFVGTPLPIFCEHFDDGDPMWQQTGNVQGEWQVGTPTAGVAAHDPPAAHSGTGVLGTTLAPPGTYEPNTLTTVESPPIDASAYRSVHLQFWRWLSIEDGSFDQATIEINGTRVWRNALDRTGTLDHVDREWRFVDLDATPYVGDDGLVQAKWTLASDLSKQLGGWNLDDVCFVGFDKSAVCGDGIVDIGEQCDDGNTADGDGCSSKCRNEIVAGGGCAAGGGAGWLLVITCAAAARGARRRDRSRRACRSRPAGRADPRRS